MAEEQLPDTSNTTWKNDKSRFGYKFLSKFGWSEEKGLGKNETGITSAVKIKRREDEVGLGMEKLTDGAGNRGWNQTTNGFNSVLASLKSEYGSPKKAKKSKKDKKSNTISVGIKYKRFSEAKSLASRSSEDLKAVLGSGTRSEKEDASGSRVEKEKKKKKKKKEKKEKKEKKRKHVGASDSCGTGEEKVVKRVRKKRDTE